VIGDKFWRREKRESR
jgi:hypothetical protein